MRYDYDVFGNLLRVDLPDKPVIETGSPSC
jgi:YD repeat-containing protein